MLLVAPPPLSLLATVRPSLSAASSLVNRVNGSNAGAMDKYSMYSPTSHLSPSPVVVMCSAASGPAVPVSSVGTLA